MTQALLLRLRRFRRREGDPQGLPIAWFLPSVLGGLILIAAIPIVLIGYFGASQNTDVLMRDRSELVLDLIVEHIDAYLSPIPAALGDAERAVASGIVDTDDDRSATGFLRGILAGHAQIKLVGLRRHDGSVLHLRRDREDMATMAMRIPADVERMLNEIRADAGPVWFGPFRSPALSEPVLAARTLLRGSSNKEKGILVVVVPLAELSAYLAQLSTDMTLTPFVLTDRERVLAHPRLARTQPKLADGLIEAGADLASFDDPVLAEIWSGEPRPLVDKVSFRRSSGHWSWSEVEVGGANGYVYRTIERYGSLPWTVGFHYPAIETRPERWTLVFIGVSGVAIVALALAAAIFVGRRMGRPILDLAQAAAAFEKMDFETSMTVRHSPVREINQAAHAFERMATRLSVFGRYLPKTLVRRLLVAGPTKEEGETRVVTVMFTDLEHYTLFSQAAPARDVVDYLNALLSRVGPIVEATGGTIDKYIGDSVMAFWGAPEQSSDHPKNACNAARLIAAAVMAFNEERREKGLAACRMRIGIHTGPVAVGNLGFNEQINYTIIGETVNIAHQLEQAGRTVLGDEEVVVMVSDTTVSEARDGFAFSPVVTCTTHGREEHGAYKMSLSSHGDADIQSFALGSGPINFV